MSDLTKIYTYVLKYDAVITKIEAWHNRYLVTIEGNAKTLWREPYKIEAFLG